MTEPSEEGIDHCIEICGDGFNYGLNPCDDGNTQDGDGCSSTCKVEEGFNCTGGGPYSPDLCLDVRRPTAEINLISSEFYVYIAFDEEVLINGVLSIDNTDVKIEGVETSYLFEWEMNRVYITNEYTVTTGVILRIY